MQVYLLGYEFPDTAFVLAGNKFYVYATPKKCASGISLGRGFAPPVRDQKML
jgi:nucleosome binding factor SPN SPT16 subunit